MSTTLTDVRNAQPGWFSRGNKRLFGDVSYKLLHGKTSKQPFLVRSTFMWSDMFGQPKTLCYRVNTIKADLSIGPLIDKVFHSLDDVKEWLKGE